MIDRDHGCLLPAYGAGGTRLVVRHWYHRARSRYGLVTSRRDLDPLITLPSASTTAGPGPFFSHHGPRLVWHGNCRTEAHAIQPATRDTIGEERRLVSVTRSRPRTTEFDPSTVDVLVVDGDCVFRESLRDSIQGCGFVAIAAANCTEALRLVTDRPPRLILVDLEMPVTNGWQFLERRRSNARLASIPVVTVGAKGTELAGRRDIEAHLAKPLEEEALLAVLTEILSRVPAGEAAPSNAVEDSPLILVVEDDDDTRASVAELLQDQGYRVARANNGQEAEAMLQSGPRPDGIVLDLWMPVMDGWTFTSRLRRLEGAPIPMVVITAAEPYWGYPVPATQVMRKPLQADAFLGLMNRLVPAANATAFSAALPASTKAKKRGPSF
jgi:CheY-like chemotaxis protein